MSVPTCFSDIIGLARTEDCCIIEDWDDSYAISNSGLYITDLPGMPQGFIDALGGCSTLWEKMIVSLENAINTFKIDVLGEIYKYWEPSRGKYKGDIGGKSFTTTIASCGTYNGLRMYSDIIGGSYILRGIYLILDVTEIVTVQIYDEYGLLYTYSMTSQAGRPKYNAIIPIELDLAGNYYFLYTTTGNPYNNKLTCNCGGWRWCFDTTNPCFGPSRDKWTEWAMVAGVCGTDLTIRDDWQTSREGAGMILHGDFICDVLGTLCSDHSDWTDEMGLAIAHAIWYKTGEYLATYIMDTEEVSRKTLLGVEQWNANRAFYNLRYVTMVNFIAENFEAEENECLQCKPPMGYKHRVQFL
jgi:hypothetical protein